MRRKSCGVLTDSSEDEDEEDEDEDEDENEDKIGGGVEEEVDRVDRELTHAKC